MSLIFTASVILRCKLKLYLAVSSKCIHAKDSMTFAFPHLLAFLSCSLSIHNKLLHVTLTDAKTLWQKITRSDGCTQALTWSLKLYLTYKKKGSITGPWQMSPLLTSRQVKGFDEQRSAMVVRHSVSPLAAVIVHVQVSCVSMLPAV